ncbi:hypothetical protein [Micromonospora sp. NPDC005189]
MPQPLAALFGGALLWAAGGGERVMVARLFDYDDPEAGPAVLGVV